MGNAVAKWGRKAGMSPVVNEVMVGLDHDDMCSIWDNVMHIAMKKEDSASPAFDTADFLELRKGVPKWAPEDTDDSDADDSDDARSLLGLLEEIFRSS